MIEKLADRFNINEACKALEVSRSGYYAWRNLGRSPRREEDAKLVDRIKTLHREHRQRLGSPRMMHHLRREGKRCGRKRIARLMKLNGIVARRKKAFRPKTTQAGKKPFPNLLAGAKMPTGPNQVWVSDITYITTLEGFMYLVTIMDLHSRRIVGWKISDTMEVPLVEAAIKRAARMRAPQKGLRFHSDRGSQYGSGQVRRILITLEAMQSMSGKGSCYDNAFAESFFSTLKAECFPMDLVFKTKQEARLAIFEYLEGYYDNHRLHSSLGYQTPKEYEENYKNSIDIIKAENKCVSADVEDRAMRGRNSSATWGSNTVGSGAAERPASQFTGLSRKRKIPGGLGDGVLRQETNKPC